MTLFSLTLTTLRMYMEHTRMGHTAHADATTKDTTTVTVTTIVTVTRRGTVTVRQLVY